MDEFNKQTRFRLDQIISIDSYFYQEIVQKKLSCKKLGKVTSTLDYIQ